MWRPLRAAARILPGIGRVVAERDRLRKDLAGTRRQVVRLRRQLRRAVPYPDRDLGYLFIVTYGRSGSTLLQGILNSLPGYLIRGENRSALHHLFKFHETCARDRNRYARRGRAASPTHPFFGIPGYRVNRATTDIRRLVVNTLLRPEPNTRVTGFKEIRWYQPDLPEYVAFLQRVFPNARFVINTRNHADVARSKWWAEKPDALVVLARVEKGILDLADQLGDAAYHVHFDDYVADPSVLEGLFTWLGEDFDEARVADAIRVRHST